MLAWRQNTPLPPNTHKHINTHTHTQPSGQFDPPTLHQTHTHTNCHHSSGVSSSLFLFISVPERDACHVISRGGFWMPALKKKKKKKDPLSLEKWEEGWKERGEVERQAGEAHARESNQWDRWGGERERLRDRENGPGQKIKELSRATRKTETYKNRGEVSDFSAPTRGRGWQSLGLDGIITIYLSQLVFSLIMIKCAAGLKFLLHTYIELLFPLLSFPCSHQISMWSSLTTRDIQDSQTENICRPSQLCELSGVPIFAGELQLICYYMSLPPSIHRQLTTWAF